METDKMAKEKHMMRTPFCGCVVDSDGSVPRKIACYRCGATLDDPWKNPGDGKMYPIYDFCPFCEFEGVEVNLLETKVTWPVKEWKDFKTNFPNTTVPIDVKRCQGGGI